jgi:glycosyltransferase involved in cell wall biosynthesis
MYTPADLTFVVCAYGDNQNLPTTIQSLQEQTVRVKIILSTSTPSDYLKGLADKFHISYYVNPERKGPGADWNFGYSKATTKLVTIAHQDDLYDTQYAERILQNASKSKDPVIIFTDYYELRDDVHVTENKILSVKRKMNAVFKNKLFRKSHFMKRRVLSVGCPICCPSVTYNKEICGVAPFNTHYINSCDYQTFVDLIEKKGSFVYIPEILMGHRISEDSATTRNLANNIRQKEDLEIFEEFWPRTIAEKLYRLYSSSEKSNDMEKKS